MARNKLDPFAERLREWMAEGKTQVEIRAVLLEDGCSVAASQLCDYLNRMRQEDAEKTLFNTIASGGRMSRELDQAFKDNPEPDIEQIVRVSKTLIMSLQVQGSANPKLLSMANNMQSTLLQYLSGRTRAELQLRKVVVAEQKFKRDTCELFLKWNEDERARKIAGGTSTNAEKIEQLGRLMFQEDWETTPAK